MPTADREPLTIEYLVTMTTHVPEGTSASAVQDVRAREAVRSGELATEGHLLRLWRPPLQPGEWRTLGLFAAAGGAQLEEVLASMPLRVWRTDEVTPLSPHPDDPARHTEKPGTPGPEPEWNESLTTCSEPIAADTAPESVDAPGREQRRTRELAGHGYLERLWMLPSPSRTLGLWQAPDQAAMDALLASLSSLWTNVQIHATHPAPE